MFVQTNEHLNMKSDQVISPRVFFSSGHLNGEDVVYESKRLSELAGLFADRAAAEEMDGNLPVYEVYSWVPVPQGTEGGLFFGLTNLHPGLVGSEYFMTKGHFHAIENRGEYYWCIQGEGILLLMDKQRETRAERMFPGTLHYIPGYTAHRVVNTGSRTLRFGACWPSDAGYNYDPIAADGFSVRVRKVGKVPVLG